MKNCERITKGVCENGQCEECLKYIEKNKKDIIFALGIDWYQQAISEVKMGISFYRETL